MAALRIPFASCLAGGAPNVSSKKASRCRYSRLFVCLTKVCVFMLYRLYRSTITSTCRIFPNFWHVLWSLKYIAPHLKLTIVPSYHRRDHERPHKNLPCKNSIDHVGSGVNVFVSVFIRQNDESNYIITTGMTLRDCDMYFQVVWTVNRLKSLTVPSTKQRDG